MKNQFLHQFLVVLTSSVAARLLLLVGIPILARYYSPDQIGQWHLFLNLLLVLSPLVSLRYEIAIVLPDQPAQSRSLFWLTVMLSCLMALLLTPVVLLFAEHAARLIGDPGLKDAVALIPLLALGLGLQQTATYWLNRHQSFSVVGIGGMLRSAAMVAIPLAAVTITDQSVGHLITGSIVAQILISAYLMWGAFRKVKESLLPISGWFQILEVARQYKKYPLFTAPYAFVSMVSSRMVLVVLAMYRQPEIVGFFAMAMQLCYLPVTFVSQSLGQVFYPRMARQATASQEKFVVRVLIGMSILATPWFVFLAWYSDSLLGLLLGESWIPAGRFVSWLALPSFMVLTTSWLVRLLDITGRQGTGLIMELAYDVVLILSLFISFYAEVSPVIVVAVFALVTVIYNIGWMYVAFRVSNFATAGLLKPAAVILVFGSLACLLCLLAGNYPLTIGSLLIQVMTCLGVQLGAWLAWRRKPG